MNTTSAMRTRLHSGRHSGKSRDGIALVLAMIILVMLLMMGLPFLLSQNNSLEGSSIFANRQQAINTRENSESVGMSIASDVLSPVWNDPANTDYTHFYDDILTKILGGDATLLDYESNKYPLRIHFDIPEIEQRIWNGIPSPQTRMGLSIEDESGKVDINGLSLAQLKDLLDLFAIHKSTEVARGIIEYKNKSPSKLLTNFGQLIEATPKNYAHHPLPDGSQKIARDPLTYVELARIQPHITLHGLGQGKDTQTELGSIFQDPATSGSTRRLIRDVHPSSTINSGQDQLFYDGEPSSNAVTSDPVSVSIPVAQAININTASDKALAYVGLGTLSHVIDSGTNERKIFKTLSDLSPAQLKKINPYAIPNKPRPPIDIKSNGIISIRSSGSSFDRAGNMIASSERDLTAFAANAKIPLEKNWDDQAEMQRLNQSRNLSLMASWPRALLRNWSGLYAEENNPNNDAAISARPLPSINTAGLLSGGWKKLFSGNSSDLACVNALVLTDDICPEGVDLINNTGSEISYRMDTNEVFSPPLNSAGDPQAMNARHISFWIKTPKGNNFTSNWQQSDITLFEVRSPIVNAGSPLIGGAADFGHVAFNPLLTNSKAMDPRLENGDNEKQNFLSFRYDGTVGQEHFTLTVGGENIEAPEQNYGAPIFPLDQNLADGFDSRVLGKAEGANTALVSPQKMSWSEHNYRFTLKPDQAYHVQVIINNTQADGMHIIVDGLVGRDLNQLNYAGQSIVIQDGDHMTAPYPISLNQVLPDAAASGNRRQAQFTAQGIQLPAPWDSIFPNPSDWLPPQNGYGIVRVNDESIRFASWSVDASALYTFQNIERGYRQFVDADAIAPSNTRVMPTHAIGSPLAPSGFSLRTGSTLHRGGSVLAEAFSSRPNAARVAAEIITTPTTFVADDGVTFTVDDISNFPSSGYIRMTGRELDLAAPLTVGETLRAVYYYTFAAGTFTITGPSLFPDDALAKTFVTEDSDGNAVVISINLLSLEVTADPTNRYNPADNLQDEPISTAGIPSRLRGSAYLQLYDVDPSSPTYGHIEWISYTDYISHSNGKHYFLNRGSGIGPNRGRLGTQGVNPALPRVFPANTRVIPVQNIGSNGHLFEMGDVVTINGRQLGTNTYNIRNAVSTTIAKINTSWQAIIRYSAPQTLDWTNPISNNITYPENAYFAFTDELPNIGALHSISVWPSWLESDVSPYKPVSSGNLISSNMPLINAWNEKFGSSVVSINPGPPPVPVITPTPDDRQIFFAQNDNRPSHNLSPGNTAPAIYDELISVPPVTGNGTVGGLSADVTPSTNASSILISGITTAGLYSINGEVVACGNTGQVIGRSLLGSDAANFKNGDSYTRLPIGPVSKLSTAVAAHFIGQVELEDPSALRRAHSFMFCKADGSACEMVQLIKTHTLGQTYYTAPWLRGMYNTTVQDWTTDDIVIAWLPRYASALPHDYSALSDSHESALLRSRSHCYVAAPLRLFGLSNAFGEVMLENNPQNAFNFEVRYLDQGYDWDSAEMRSTNAGTSSLLMPPNLSAGNNNLPEGGDLEMRIHWKYNDAPYAGGNMYQQLLHISAAANRAPTFKSIMLEGRSSGIRILDATAAR